MERRSSVDMRWHSDKASKVRGISHSAIRSSYNYICEPWSHRSASYQIEKQGNIHGLLFIIHYTIWNNTGNVLGSILNLWALFSKQGCFATTKPNKSYALYHFRQGTSSGVLQRGGQTREPEMKWILWKDLSWGKKVNMEQSISWMISQNLGWVLTKAGI